ncbi:MAG: hypothetical protein WB524_17965, partial [Acidobacteriaceae bacterium]
PGTESAKAPGTESAKAPGTESAKAPGTESARAPGTGRRVPEKARALGNTGVAPAVGTEGR